MTIEYEDRGLLKYYGMYTSEHTERIAKEKESKKVNPRKMQMDSDEIGIILTEAARSNLEVAIQKEERDLNGNYPDDISGKINGYDELGIFVGNQKVNYDEIRHIEIISFKKWSFLL